MEENAVAGGFGAAVLELLQARGVDDAVVRIAGLPDSFVVHGAQGLLLEQCGLDSETVAARARELVGAGSE